MFVGMGGCGCVCVCDGVVCVCREGRVKVVYVGRGGCTCMCLCTFVIFVCECLCTIYGKKMYLYINIKACFSPECIHM